MTDRDLVREILYRKEWNQEDLAKRLGVTQPIVSRVLNRKQDLNPEARDIAEEIYNTI